MLFRFLDDIEDISNPWKYVPEHISEVSQQAKQLVDRESYLRVNFRVYFSNSVVMSILTLSFSSEYQRRSYRKEER